MARRIEVVAVSVPDLRVVRWWSDELYAHLKETYCIVRVESGRSEWWGGGALRRSGPGSVQIKHPGDVHREISRDGPVSLQIVSLPAPMVEGAIGAAGVHGQLAPGDARGAAFQRLHDAVRAGADRLALEVAVSEAIDALASAGEGRCAHTRPVRRALELLRARLADPVTLDELAAHAGLDKFHLCRAFRAHIGLAPHAYLTHLRIARARHLLAAGVRAGDVAAEVGFYDQSQLNRHFKRIVGTTPGQFARAL